MRKEESKLKKKLYTALILLVLGSSIIGFTFSSVLFTSGDGLFGSGKIKRGGLELLPTSSGFSAVSDEQVFEFAYLPEDVSDVASGRLINVLTASRMVYFTSEANSSFAVQISGTEFDMARLLDARHNTFAEVTFTAQNDFGKQVISCKNATGFIPVVYFNFTNSTTEIAEENNCFVVNFGSEFELQRIKDSLVYRLLGVEINEN